VKKAYVARDDHDSRDRRELDVSYSFLVLHLHQEGLDHHVLENDLLRNVWRKDLHWRRHHADLGRRRRSSGFTIFWEPGITTGRLIGTWPLVVAMPAVNS
jgi:hypothetical protein